MSAYAHVKDGTAYPAVMITTGFNDPRVASWLPGKMAALLQAATASGKVCFFAWITTPDTAWAARSPKGRSRPPQGGASSSGNLESRAFSRRNNATGRA